MLKHASKLMAVSFFLCSSCFCIDLEQDHIQLKHFVTANTNDDGEVTWRLRSDHATLQGDTTHLVNAKLVLFNEDGTRIIVTTPACIYTPQTSKLTSDEKIKIESQTLSVTGKGYGILLQKREIFIRNDSKAFFASALEPAAE